MKHMKWIIGLALVLLLTVGLAAGAMASEESEKVITLTVYPSRVSKGHIGEISVTATVQKDGSSKTLSCSGYDIATSPVELIISGTDTEDKWIIYLYGDELEGDYTITATGSGNYEGYTGTAAFEIYDLENQPPEAPTAATDLVYNGEAHPLVTLASPTENYNYWYKTEESEEWSSTIPTGTDAGDDYSVIWGYSSTEADATKYIGGTISNIAITPATLTITWPDYITYYTGEEQSIVPTVKCGETEVQEGTDTYSIKYIGESDRTHVTGNDIIVMIELTGKGQDNYILSGNKALPYQIFPADITIY